jgi:hypothetical protein
MEIYLDYTGVVFHAGVLYAVWADNANSPVPNYSGDTSFLDIYIAVAIPPFP